MDNRTMIPFTRVYSVDKQWFNRHLPGRVAIRNFYNWTSGQRRFDGKFTPALGALDGKLPAYDKIIVIRALGSHCKPP